MSLKRLQIYLNLDQLNWLTYYTFNQIDFNNDSTCLDIRDGEFDWKSTPDEKGSENQNEDNNLVNPEEHCSTLKRINFKIKKGQLIGCIGNYKNNKTTFHLTLSINKDPN